MATVPYLTCLQQPQAWSNTTQYQISMVYPAGVTGYQTIPVVIDAGLTYYANGTSIPVLGTHPADDSAWSLFASDKPNILADAAVATTANITLSGEQTIDGVLTSTSRVLVKNQTLSQDNGVYVSAAGAWARATDANIWNELVNAQILVTGGTTQAGYGYTCTVAAGGTLGTTPVTWVKTSQSPTLPISIANGGTGATSKSSGYNALSPLTTLGDIVAGGASGTGTRVAGNTTAVKQYLQSLGDGAASALPTFAQVAFADISGTNAGVIASVLTGYVSGAGTVAATDSILQAVQKLNGNLVGSFTATNAANGGVVSTITPIQQKWASGTTGGAITNGTAAQLTLTWAAAFTTAMYAVSLTCLDSTANVPLTTKVISQTTSAIVVEIANTSLATPTGGAVTIYAQAVGH